MVQLTHQVVPSRSKGSKWPDIVLNGPLINVFTVKAVCDLASAGGELILEERKIWSVQEVLTHFIW